MYKKIIILVGFITLLIAVGFICFRPAPVNNVVVAVAKAKYLPIFPAISVIGNIVAAQGIDVSSKTNGMIKNIYFQSGQLVKKGDLLVSLDNDEIKARLDQSVAKLSLATQDYERYNALVKKGSVSRSDFDKVVSQLASAQAEVNYETALLNQTYIRAPFNGKVGIRKINIGQYISPGLALVNIQALSPLYVDFNIPEQYLNQLQLSAKINLFDDSGSKIIGRGKVVALDSSLSLDTRTLSIRALIESISSEKLMPGMYAKVDLSLSKSRNSILIPQSAIVYSPLGQFVYLVLDNQVKQMKVELGEQVGDDVVITSGLKKEDKVVCAGQIKLHPGVAIKEVAY